MEKSIIRQVKCPTLAKPAYSKYQSVDFIVETLIPETIGYLVGYGVTGTGSMDAKSAYDRMGFSGSLDERVLGYNAFVSTGVPCDSLTSAPECTGQDNFLYIKAVPQQLDNKGLLMGGMVGDIMDMANAGIVSSFYGQGSFSGKCAKRTLPVGTNLYDASARVSSEQAFRERKKKCNDECVRTLGSKSSSQLVANCRKKCNSGHWLESKCTADPKEYVYAGKKYNVIEGFSMKNTESFLSWSVCLGVFILMIVVLMYRIA